VWGDGAIAAAVLMLAVAVYLNALPGSFIGDDEAIVRDNPLVASFSLKRIFLTNYWWGMGFADNLYRPLTMLSYALNRRLFGPEAFSFHAVNILLHGMVSALLFVFVTSLGLGRTVGVLAATLFAVHPIHAEAVNVIVGRADLLMALFVLAALVIDGRLLSARNWAVPLCLGCALLSKESGVAAVALVPFADAFRTGSVAESARRRWPFFLLLALIAAGWLIVVQYALLPGRWGPHTTAYNNPLIAMRPVARTLSAFGVQISYLRDILFPRRLGLVYGKPDLHVVETLLSPSGALVTLFWGTAAVAGAAAWRARSGIGFAAAFYAIAAAPASNIFILIAVLMAERIAYLPSAAVCVGIGSAAAWLGRRLCALPAGRLLRFVAPAFVLCYGTWLCAKTVARNPDFADPVRLSRAIVAAKPRSGQGWYVLGLELNKRGNTEEAMKSLTAGVAVDPDYPELWYALALHEIGAGRAEEGLSHAQRYLTLVPDSLKVNTIVAQALIDLKRPDEAMMWLGKVEPLLAADPVFLWTKGTAMEALGRVAEAEVSYAKVFEITGDPGFPARHAKALMLSGQSDRAERILRLAIRRWHLPALHRLLGIALAAQGRNQEAAEYFRKASEAGMSFASPLDEHSKSDQEGRRRER